MAPVCLKRQITSAPGVANNFGPTPAKVENYHGPRQLLSRVSNPEEFTNLDGLHGYLFGLAIIPEPIMPSEWIATFFGENMPVVKNEQEASAMFGGLFSAYNRIIELNQKGKLVFPFDLDTFKPKANKINSEKGEVNGRNH